MIHSGATGGEQNNIDDVKRYSTPVLLYLSHASLSVHASAPRKPQPHQPTWIINLNLHITRTKPTLLHEIFVLIERQRMPPIRVVTSSDLRTQHARALLSSFEVLVTPLTTRIRMHTHARIIGTQAHTLPITHSRSTSSPTRSWHLCLRVFAPWESTCPSAG